MTETVTNISDKNGAKPEPETDSLTKDAEFTLEAKALQLWLDHVGTLVDEAKLTLKHDGFYTCAVDPANVGMIEAQLDECAFESYNVPNPGIVGVPLKRVQEVLKAASTDDLIHLEFSADHRNLLLSWGGHEFTVGLINPDSIRKRPELLDLDLPVTLEFEKAGDLKQAIKFSNNVSTHIKIASEPQTNRFIVYAEGDTDSYEGRFENTEEITYKHEVDQRCEALYSLEYLTDIASAWTTNQPITVIHGEDFPLELHMNLWLNDNSDDEGDVGAVTYMLAPRIRSD